MPLSCCPPLLLASRRRQTRESAIETLTAILAETADQPWLQAAALFLGTFVLEEGAMLAGAMLAGAGQLPSLAALAALYAGIVVSDWALFALGRMAAWLPWAKRRIGAETLAHGRGLLSTNITWALISARLVPWLLFPIFCACGFLGVSFARFALVNAVIALVYTMVLFWALLLFDSLLLSHLRGWGWVVAALLILGLLLLKRRLAKPSEG